MFEWCNFMYRDNNVSNFCIAQKVLLFHLLIKRNLSNSAARGDQMEYIATCNCFSISQDAPQKLAYILEQA